MFWLDIVCFPSYFVRRFYNTLFKLILHVYYYIALDISIRILLDVRFGFVLSTWVLREFFPELLYILFTIIKN